ncbi:MAG: PTS sugar transporter subunit IIA [Anaerolineales bacterium]
MEIFSAFSNSDREGLLRELSTILESKGYVKDTYLESIINRENRFPTGLKVEELVNIAIPHTDVEHVLKPTMVVIKHSSGDLRFYRMDEPNDEIAVDVVFLLVVKEPDGYVNFLAALTSLFQDADFIEQLTSNTPSRICAGLVEKLKQFDLSYEGELQ